MFEGGVADCPEKHGLRAYNTPNDSMACDHCNALMLKGVPFYGCKQCKTRICGKCFRGEGAEKSVGNSFFVAAPADCPGKHGLKSYAAPTDGLACDRCKTLIAKGTPFHGCKPCKTRICGGCFKAGDP